VACAETGALESSSGRLDGAGEKCVRETEILVEQQPPQGVFVWDHAGLVINEFSGGHKWEQRHSTSLSAKVTKLYRPYSITRTHHFEGCGVRSLNN